MQTKLQMTDFLTELTNFKDGATMKTKKLKNAGKLGLKLFRAELHAYLKEALEGERNYNEYYRGFEGSPAETKNKSEPPGTYLTRNK